MSVSNCAKTASEQALSVGNWGEVLQAIMPASVSRLSTMPDGSRPVTGKLGRQYRKRHAAAQRSREEYFSPAAEIKQVIILGQANFQSPKRYLFMVMELGIDKDLPYVPMKFQHSQRHRFGFRSAASVAVLRNGKRCFYNKQPSFKAPSQT
ncbi:MAG: hypothetical protein IPN95_19475 [Bacteroidetes bacterium]|nr:hypothetical protein [Bacteroidota bacterium]